MTQPVFFYGVVENNVDPERLGRVQVRFHGLHTSQKVQDDTTGIPTSDLPWAICAPSITEAGVSGIGQAPVGIVQGAWVMGVFRDKGNQSPVVFATLPGRPGSSGRPSEGFSDPAGVYPLTDRLGESDVNRLARNEKIDQTIVQIKKDNIYSNIQTAGEGGTAWSEPPNPYAAQYPLNAVHESRSGHIRETDDTPLHERIHTWHRSGTFEEYHPDGSKVTKVIGNNYTIMMQDDNVVINGACNITVVGDARIKTEGSLFVDAAKNMTFRANETITFEAKNIISAATTKVKTSAPTVESFATDLIIDGTNTNMRGNTLKMESAGAWSVKAGNMQMLGAGPSTISASALNLTGAPVTINSGPPAMVTPAPTSALDPVSEQIASEYGSYHTAVAESVAIPIVGPDSKQEDKGAELIPPTPTGPIKTEMTPCGLTVSDPIDYEMVLAAPFQLKHFTRLTFVTPQELRDMPKLGFNKQQLVCNMKALAENCLVPLLAKFPGFRFNSAFRSDSSTFHGRGMAVDISWPDCPDSQVQPFMQAVYDWIVATKMPFDQLISEKNNSLWLHLAYDGTKTTHIPLVMSTPHAGRKPKPIYTKSFVTYPGTMGGDAAAKYPVFGTFNWTP